MDSQETINESQAAGLQLANTKLPVVVYSTPKATSVAVAQVIADVIRTASAAGKGAVLALAPGSTPQQVYRELIRMHKEEGLDFSHVSAFVSVEFFGISRAQAQSVHRSLRETFFNHINIPDSQVNILDSEAAGETIEEYCEAFEQKIQDAGGIDFALLGIGSNGHIAANEPFSGVNSRTRLCVLDPITRLRLASDFFGEKNVPAQALTMGMGTLLESRQVVLMALGEHKARIVRDLAEGDITNRIPASALQEHANAMVCLDPASASAMQEVAMPWTSDSVEWDETMITRTIVWLCEQTGKALSKLEDDDFRNHNLHQLLRLHGPSHVLALRVFGWLQATIHGGQVIEGQQKVICFSPHPDDDVISMGGTLIRLNEEGHETHVAYMTSGNIAVFDHDAQRIADLVTEYNHLFGIENDKSIDVERRVRESLNTKQPGEPDIDAVLKIKGLIRWSEAKAGAIEVGCDEDNLHFLDLPFYRTGTVEKRPVGDVDEAIIVSLLQRIQPDIIYVAGDLSDPHGTHRVCAEAILGAIHQMLNNGEAVPDVLLYRGAWHEYAIHEIDITVPLSPAHLMKKRKAIFMHESQKDEALFPGSDPREFWQRAEDRNKGTAKKFNDLGLPEFLAIEAFQRWTGQTL